jgi:hypothetical protein
MEIICDSSVESRQPQFDVWRCGRIVRDVDNGDMK